MITRNPITLQGRKILEAKLSSLRKAQEVNIEAIAEARKKGDLSENFEYHAAKKRNAELSSEIGKLDQYLCTSISPNPPANLSMGCFKAHVKFENTAGEASEYVIVGDMEAAPEKGSISINSALAQAILGKTKGSKFTLNGNEYQITHINLASDELLAKVILDDDWSKGL